MRELVYGCLFLAVTGVYGGCGRDQCMLTCNSGSRQRGVEETELNHCLELCSQLECNGTDIEPADSGSGTQEQTVKEAVVKYFSSPSRWIPTVVGALVGIGIAAVVIYYSRKSWRKRERFPKYGFSRLRGRHKHQDTELTNISDSH